MKKSRTTLPVPAPTTVPNNFPSALLSFYYTRKVDFDQFRQRLGMGMNLLADSGGFSASRMDINIDIREYAAWLKQWRRQFAIYCNFDVIYDWKTSRANWEWLKGEGLDPLPIFHVGSPLAELDRIVQEAPYICLGGMIPYAIRVKVLHRWLSSCFARIPKTTRVHGLGLGTGPAFTDFPWTSTDSSTFGANARYGVLLLMRFSGLTQRKSKAPLDVWRAERELRAGGGGIGLRGRSLYAAGFRSGLRVEAMMRARIPEFRLYFAMTDVQSLLLLGEVWRDEMALRKSGKARMSFARS